MVYASTFTVGYAFQWVPPWWRGSDISGNFPKKVGRLLQLSGQAGGSFSLPIFGGPITSAAGKICPPTYYVAYLPLVRASTGYVTPSGSVRVYFFTSSNMVMVFFLWWRVPYR